VFRRVKASDMLTLEITSDNKLNITLKSDTKRQFSMPIIDIEESEQKVPDLNFKTSIQTTSSLFTSAIEDVDIVADSVLFELDKDKLTLSAKGDMSTANIEIKGSDDTKITVDEARKFKAKYSIEYLKKMITGSKISDMVTVKFDTDYPLKLEYKAIDKVVLSFILAPRVEND